jgi:hypothetical protein
MQHKYGDAGWSSPVARQAHNLKVVGSNPAPATNLTKIFNYVKSFIAARKSTPLVVYSINNPFVRVALSAPVWCYTNPYRFFICESVMDSLCA